VQIDSRISRTQYQYTLQDADRAELADWATKLLAKLRTETELADVASDQQQNGLQISVNVDREKASRLNILPQAIDDTLYDAFGQRQVATISRNSTSTASSRSGPAVPVGPGAGKIYVKSTTDR
jgi:multidrug efflux pump subunit AcrB